VKGAAPWRDTYVGGLVSNLQVVQLITYVAKNRSMASDLAAMQWRQFLDFSLHV
jgi:hypothetical protein